MEIELNETQSMLQDAARRFFSGECSLARVREYEREGRTDTELWQKLAGQGYLGAPFPEAVGGAGGGLVHAGLLVHEAARCAALVPMVEALSAALTLHHHGEGAPAAELVQKVIHGDALPVPAVLESDGNINGIEDGSGITLRADASGALHGEKFYVDYAQEASHHLALAHSETGPALFLVAHHGVGIHCEPLPSIGRTPKYRVRYKGARGVRVAGPQGISYLVRTARALTCAQLLACMEMSLEQTVAYTNIREQFGRPLSGFQAVQHHAADMAMHVESSRFLTYELLDAMDRGIASEEQAALVKASLSRALPEVVMMGHQLHGGQGYIEENDLYFFTIRGRDRCLAWGGPEECLAQVARTVEQKARRL